MTTLSKRVDALVVGAGPVGLFTALGLARAGVSVEVIDRAWRSAAQSYACGLHAGTIGVLASAGLDQTVLEAGVRVDAVGFYEGKERRAELRLGEAGGPHPYLLVVPQDRLEELLEEALKAHGIRVRWGHRLDDLNTDSDSVRASVEKLAVTSVGYPYARSEEMVESVSEVAAHYVIGADGAGSHVRQILGIELEKQGPPSLYDIVEFDSLSPAVREVRITVGPGTADVFWPQQGSTCRWSLEVPGATGSEADHPNKERRSIVVLDDEPDSRERARLTEQLKGRAPWFEAGVREIDWTTLVTFTPALAKAFGRDRCWLAGDAAHQTSPVGMQSMNIGLREGADLATRIVQILRLGGAPGLLPEYDEKQRQEWKALLGGGKSLTVLPKASAWVKGQKNRILGWIPGSGTDLAAYLKQLGLGWATG